MRRTAYQRDYYLKNKDALNARQRERRLADEWWESNAPTCSAYLKALHADPEVRARNDLVRLKAYRERA
jgi:hypothetical protein